jgi:hypothetical protein
MSLEKSFEKVYWHSPIEGAIAKALEYWESDHPLDAGRILYERVPKKLRPIWAANALELAYRFSPPTSEVEAVLAFARDSDEWGKGLEDKRKQAHGLFDTVRRLTLQYANRDSFYETTLLLAENTAKVTYNAYGYPAPFDHDAGWWVVADFAQVVANVNDAAFAAKAWSLMSSEEYVKLKAPIMCHPACPVCNVWFHDDSDIVGTGWTGGL